MTIPGRKTWLKLYAYRTLHGSTTQELQPDERWVWIGLLCLAADSPVSGTVCLGAGVPYTPSQLPRVLHVSPSLLRRALNKMVAADKLSTDADGIHITNWEHYQGDYERMRQVRTRQANELPPQKPPKPDSCEGCGDHAERLVLHHIDGNPKNNAPTNLTYLCVPCHMALHRPETPLPPERLPAFKGRHPRATNVAAKAAATNSATDVADRRRGRGERGEGERSSSASSTARVAELVHVYEANIGAITPIVAQELDQIADEYPAGWFEAAVKEALDANARSLNYVKAILQRWSRDGFKTPLRRQPAGGAGARGKKSLPTAEQLQQGWDTHAES